MKRTGLLLSILTTIYSYGQTDTPCTAGSPSATVLTPGASCSYVAGTTAGATTQTNAANGGTPSCGSMGPDVWYQFTAPASGAVSIVTQAGSITDGVMALYSGTCGAFTQLSCSDDVNGLMPAISQSGLTPGTTYFIRFWRYGGGTGTFNICLQTTSVPTNTTCAQPTPICSGSPITFTANTGGTPASTVNPGNNYGCLSTSPNPSWFYLNIATGGSLIVDISAGSDVDFAIWGPYPNLSAATTACNSYPAPVDCSYSIAAVEQVNVNPVVANQVYVLLVTNYANTVQNISVNNAGGTATTNCSIVPLPVGLSAWTGEDTENGVLLTWSTESEHLNQYFAVQHMTEDQYWETIGIVDGNGSTQIDHNYRLLDENPAIGNNYYRLMQVDNNGDQHITSAISVAHHGPTTFVVYPNPSNGLFAISSSDISDIHLYDLTGQEIPVVVSYLPNSVSIDATGIANGLYNVRIVESGIEKTQRIAVAKK